MADITVDNSLSTPQHHPGLTNNEHHHFIIWLIHVCNVEETVLKFRPRSYVSVVFDYCLISVCKQQLECGPMSNVMVALPNIGGALCSMLLSLADAHYQMPCSNAAKMRKPLKLATGLISAASRPKFTILCRHLEEILLLNKFFPLVDTCEDIAQQSCTMVRRWLFFVSCISSKPCAARFRPAF